MISHTGDFSLLDPDFATPAHTADSDGRFEVFALALKIVVTQACGAFRSYGRGTGH